MNGPVSSLLKPSYLRTVLDDIWVTLDLLTAAAVVVVLYALLCVYLEERERRDKERAEYRRRQRGEDGRR